MDGTVVREVEGHPSCHPLELMGCGTRKALCGMDPTTTTTTAGVFLPCEKKNNLLLLV